MLELKSVNLQKDKIDILVIPVCEDKDIHDNQTIKSLIRKAKALKEFKGEKDDEVTFYDPEQVSAKRVIFLGIGKAEDADTDSLRAMSGKIVKKSIKKDFSQVLIAVPSPGKIRQQMPDVLEAMMEGAYLGNHLFDKYKEEKKHKPLKKISFLVIADVAKRFKSLGAKVSRVCEGTFLAREWVSTPSNEKSPTRLAKDFSALARKEKLKVTVMDERTLRRHGFGAILAVGSGSESKPRMVVMEYKSEKAKKTLALVGKGITFDSGGINLKPGGSSRDMKIDMAGAAAVAATLITAAKLKPNLNIIGLMPLVENMPSGSAYRPGDIIKTYHGKTVEIGNTDAEGRMILIDAIAYAVKTYKPDILIDLATLTGACITALGEKIAGLFSRDDELAQWLVESGERTHERCWHLPMPDDYKESLKSEIADINNIADMNGGGAITAALFLSEFVGEDPRWAHIDIAGPSFAKKENAYCGAGGTGFGVRLLWDLIEKL